MCCVGCYDLPRISYSFLKGTTHLPLLIVSLCKLSPVPQISKDIVLLFLRYQFQTFGIIYKGIQCLTFSRERGFEPRVLALPTLTRPLLALQSRFIFEIGKGFEPLSGLTVHVNPSRNTPVTPTDSFLPIWVFLIN